MKLDNASMRLAHDKKIMIYESVFLFFILPEFQLRRLMMTERICFSLTVFVY